MPTHPARKALLAGRDGWQVVTALGITGHQAIPSSVRDFVESAIRDVLRDAEAPLCAVTSLAAGADQLFAAELVRIGGRLHVIVPSRNYERTFASEDDLESFRLLLKAAQTVTRLDYSQPSEEAFLAAGRSVVDNCEVLIAVWDGKPAKGLGGTADVVGYAQDMGKPVRILWPDGTVG